MVEMNGATRPIDKPPPISLYGRQGGSPKLLARLSGYEMDRSREASYERLTVSTPEYHVMLDDAPASNTNVSSTISNT